MQLLDLVDDCLDSLGGEVAERWQDLGGTLDQVDLATERQELALADPAQADPAQLV